MWSSDMVKVVEAEEVASGLLSSIVQLCDERLASQRQWLHIRRPGILHQRRSLRFISQTVGRLVERAARRTSAVWFAPKVRHTGDFRKARVDAIVKYPVVFVQRHPECDGKRTLDVVHSVRRPT